MNFQKCVEHYPFCKTQGLKLNLPRQINSQFDELLFLSVAFLNVGVKTPFE